MLIIIRRIRMTTNCYYNKKNTDDFGEEKEREFQKII